MERIHDIGRAPAFFWLPDVLGGKGMASGKLAGHGTPEKLFAELLGLGLKSGASRECVFHKDRKTAAKWNSMSNPPARSGNRSTAPSAATSGGSCTSTWRPACAERRTFPTVCCVGVRKGHRHALTEVSMDPGARPISRGCGRLAATRHKYHVIANLMILAHWKHGVTKAGGT
jgi:hypothetical protein